MTLKGTPSYTSAVYQLFRLTGTHWIFMKELTTSAKPVLQQLCGKSCLPTAGMSGLAVARVQGKPHPTQAETERVLVMR